MEPNDREKTAFTMENNLYEFVKMPFGLCNSPNTFIYHLMLCYLLRTLKIIPRSCNNSKQSDVYLFLSLCHGKICQHS